MGGGGRGVLQASQAPYLDLPLCEPSFIAHQAGTWGLKFRGLKSRDLSFRGLRSEV